MKLYTKGVFNEELLTLEKAREKVTDPKYKNNVLLGDYQELLKEYNHLLKISKKTLTISDLQGKELRKREIELRNLLDNANQGFLTFGNDLIVDKEYSAECVRIFGKKISDQPVLDLLNQDEQAKLLMKESFYIFFNSGNTDVFKLLPNLIEVNDKEIQLEFKPIIGFNFCEDLVMIILTDVTEKLKSQKRLEYLSYHDSLTSLYNRAQLDRSLENMKESMFPLAIFVIDLNGLKLTNDVFGHEMGDQLIQQTANSIIQSCPLEAEIFRWGGDEFLILLPNASETGCLKIKEEIFANSKLINTHPVELSMSIGVSIMEDKSIDFSVYFHTAEKRMYREKLKESRLFQSSILQSISFQLEDMNIVPKGHVERIKKASTLFANKLGYAGDTLLVQNLHLIAELHELGKITIPKTILCKTTPLTEQEWELMKTHSEAGYRIAQSAGYSFVADAVLAMHERWDGRGYPYGLKRDDIPLTSRILSILNVFDVMTNDQIYKKAVDVQTALYEIEKESSQQFDPYLVREFLRYVGEIY